MADVAGDTEGMANEIHAAEKLNTNANGEKLEDNGKVDDTAEEVKTDGNADTNVDIEMETNEQATEKTDDNEKNADTEMRQGSSSKSPEHKRKEAPASVTAHERHGRERKRIRGAPRYINIKARFDGQPESNDPDEIRRQVEFYFSDSNLPIDAYLLDVSGGHRNSPVDLKIIHDFKRMRHFQPFSAVVAAVKDSKFLNLDDDNMITRRVPLDEKFTDSANKNRTILHTKSMSRSIYAKGFGDETPSTQLDIEAFFATYGDFSSVRLRRTDDGTFKGSVFVEFKNEEIQAQFLELDPKPKFDGQELEILSKGDYVEMKHSGIIDGEVKPRSPDRGYSRADNKSRGRGSRDYGDRRRSGDYEVRERGGRDDDGFDRDNWRARRDRDQDRRGRGRRGGREGWRGRGRDRGHGQGGRGGRGGRSASPDKIDMKKRRGASPDEIDMKKRRGASPDEIDKKKRRVASPDEIDKKKRKRDDEDEGRDQEDVPTRAEAEFKRARLEEGASEAKGKSETVAGAMDVETNGGVAADGKAEETTS